MKIFKKSKCKHENVECLTNCYGDFIYSISSISSITRSIWICKDCKKILKRRYLEPSCKIINFMNSPYEEIIYGKYKEQL